MADTDETIASPGTVQCEITGKWVPEDEVITIQGHRVCAEGKAELLERLQAGELLPGEVERPSVLRRFLCIFLDGMIVGVVHVLLGMAFLGTAFFAATGAGGVGSTVVAVLPLVNAGISLAYYTVMHGMFGQTLGKMAGRIRVVNGDQSPITMSTALLRALYYQVPAIVSALIMAVAILADSQGGLAAADVVNVLFGIYIIASVIVALVDREQQRAIHDRLAGTRVIFLG